MLSFCFSHFSAQPMNVRFGTAVKIYPPWLRMGIGSQELGSPSKRMLDVVLKGDHCEVYVHQPAERVGGLLLVPV